MNEPIAFPQHRIGVLLVNLGTPDAPTAAAVRTYLKEFLSDPRVVERQDGLWKFVLNAIILPLRPRIKARAYRKIWNSERDESPLKTITRSAGRKACTTARAGSQQNHCRLGDALWSAFDRCADRFAYSRRL